MTEYKIEDTMSRTTAIERSKTAGECRTDAAQDEDLQAFFRMLPDLLEEHRGEYALFVGRKFVRAGSLVDMMQLARSEYPGTRFLVQPIQEELPEVCLGGPRLRGR